MKTFNKNKIALTLAITFMSGLLNTAFANENTVEDKNVLIKENGSKGGLVEIGTPISSAPLKGFAKSLPLITVLQQIVPNGWVVKKNDSKGKKFETNRIVSWDGGQDWVSTLKKVSIDNNFNIIINWNKKEVILFETLVSVPVMNKEIAMTITTPKKNSVFELEAEPITWIAGNSQQTIVKETIIKETKVKANVVHNPLNNPVNNKVVTPVMNSQISVPLPAIKVPLKSTWVFDSKLSLKQNVIKLAEMAGYKVDWRGEDYPVDEERVLTGMFDGEDGPIKQLSVDYGPSSRVEQPLSFIFFQNHYLIVENWRFEQAGSPQYLKK